MTCFQNLVTANTTSTSGSGTLPGNTVTNPKEDLKGITTRSGVTIQGPKTVNHDTEVTKDTMPPANNGSTEDVQPPVVQIQSRNPNPEPIVAPVVAPGSNSNETLSLARTDEEHCFRAVILNKLPRKLGDPGKFLIPCEFPGMDECLALADLGASINLMPFSVWEKLSLPDLTPTCMTLELADRSISKPMGIAKDISVKVGVFHFPADFVVVDFEPDPRVPLILGRIGSEAITYNMDQTSRYSANYTHMTANKIDVIDMACEEYSQEVLGFTDIIASGNSTPYHDPIVATSSPTLTPFGDSDFLLLEEADSFLGLADDPDCPAYNPFYYDPEGHSYLEAILNIEPPLPPQVKEQINLSPRSPN
ncbi:reverse transcriptase domain-containing protein [Tanacetum coccineum]